MVDYLVFVRLVFVENGIACASVRRPQVRFSRVNIRLLPIKCVLLLLVIGRLITSHCARDDRVSSLPDRWIVLAQA